MINEEQAQKIVNEYQSILRDYESEPTETNLIKLKKIESKCLDKLSYLVKMKVGKYRQFSNYDDLFQEGLIVLLRAMKNYSSDKGSFFWWAHKYIGTKIFRSASNHSVIKIPIKQTAKIIPYKEIVMPLLIENKDCPDVNYDKKETREMLTECYDNLTNIQKQVIDMMYGIKNNNPMPLHKVCLALKLSRQQCERIIEQSLIKMKRNMTYINDGYKIDMVDE